MPVRGQGLVAKNIKTYGGGFLKHVNKQMKLISEIMDTQVTKNISLTDHSLKDLARLGHPYAARSPQPIHTPAYLVHKQSGQLLESKKSGIREANINLGILLASAFVQLDEKEAPHALSVVFGTSKMMPRPVLTGSVREIQDKALTILRTNLKDFNFGFRGR